MNQSPIFANFLRCILGVTQNSTLNEIIRFIETFDDLLYSSDNDIETFLKEVHSSNSARSANARILISSNIVMGLKSILFQFKDGQICDDLPDATILTAIYAGQVNIMRRLRQYTLDDVASRENVKRPNMKVPKSTNTNVEYWNTAFSSVVVRQYSLAGVILNYLLRDKYVVDFNSAWSSRDENINNCIYLNGTIYKYDKEGLY